MSIHLGFLPSFIKADFLIFFLFAVVPQPVYMNMNDLNALAAQKVAAQQQEFQDLPEDSPELKTPTAEDIMVPEQKVRIPKYLQLGSKLYVDPG